jgi:CRISPR-associated endonuclease Cas2
MPKANYLICYDIAESKRLQKFHYWLAKQAMMMQRSVYLLPYEERQIHLFADKVKNRINTDEDVVWIYRLSNHHPIYTRKPLINFDGIHWYSDAPITTEYPEKMVD